MVLPVTEGAVIGKEYAVGILELAIKYNKSVEWALETIKESLDRDKQTLKELS